MQAGKKPTEPKPTGNDWQRVKRGAAVNAPVAPDAVTNTEPYDPNDPTDVAAFCHSANIKRGMGRPAATVKRPTLSMRVDADVLAAFKATGPGWQTRINSMLRDALARGAEKGRWFRTGKELGLSAPVLHRATMPKIRWPKSNG
jgi:uncharacterized protein (DUF4415 family)